MVSHHLRHYSFESPEFPTLCADSEILPTNKKQQAARDKQPTTNNKQRGTSNQQRGTSNKQQATRDKQRGTSNKQQATRDKQRGTSNKQQATRDKQPTISNEGQATTATQHTTSFPAEADSLWYSYISPVRHTMFGFSAIVRQFLTPPPTFVAVILPILIRALGANDVFNNVPGRVGFDIILCDLDLCVVTKSESVVRTLRSALFFSVVDFLGCIFSSGPSWPRVSHCACRTSRTLSAKVFAGRKRLYPGLSSSDFRRGLLGNNRSFLTSPSRVTLPWRSGHGIKIRFWRSGSSKQKFRQLMVFGRYD